MTNRRLLITLAWNSVKESLSMVAFVVGAALVLTGAFTIDARIGLIAVGLYVTMIATIAAIRRTS